MVGAEEDGIGGRRSGVLIMVLMVPGGVRGVGVVGVMSAASGESPVVTDGQRPWIRDMEPCSSDGSTVTLFNF